MQYLTPPSQGYPVNRQGQSAIYSQGKSSFAQGSYQQYQSSQQQRTVTTQIETRIPHLHQYQIRTEPEPPKQIILPPKNQNQASSEVNYIQRKQIINEPVLKQTYHVERELQVISIEEVEKPWKTKCVELEVRIYDLETELARFKRLGLSEGNQSDEGRINELEDRNRRLEALERDTRTQLDIVNEELDEWRNKYRQLQSDTHKQLADNQQLRELREAVSHRDVLIHKLEQELANRDKRMIEMESLITNLNQTIDEQNAQLDDADQQLNEFKSYSTQITIMTAEVDTWKKKFKELNQEYFKMQEDLMMARAELDSIKNQKTVITTEQTKIVRGSNISGK